MEGSQIRAAILLILDVLGQVEVDAQAERAVDELSHDSCVEPLVKFFDSTNFVDFSRHVEGVG